MLCSSILFSGNSCGVELVVAGFEGSQECQMLSKANLLEPAGCDGRQCAESDSLSLEH